jgi:ABC-type transporter MlaC component
MSRRSEKSARPEEPGILYYRRVNLLSAIASIGLAFMMTAPGAWAASPGEAVVRGAIDSMKALPAAEGHPEARRKLLDSLDSALALDLLAKQALGPQWAKLSEAERRHFVAIFTESLEKLAFPRAAAALAQVKVTYLSEAGKDSTEVVHTTIANDQGGQMPIDFEVAKRGNRWQIVDARIDGTSIAQEVSTRVQNALQSDGYQKLVEELQMQIRRADEAR